jgi:hypothetical protein
MITAEEAAPRVIMQIFPAGPKPGVVYAVGRW